MGAHDFECRGRGDTAADAYRDATDTALYESGNDPYNGTISTTSGFKMLLPIEGEDEQARYERILDNTEKWGNCFCWQDPDDPKLWHFAGWAAS